VIGAERDVWSLEFGAQVRADGGVRFRVWAPLVDQMAVVLPGGNQRSFRMTRDGEEFHVTVPDVEAGADYAYEACGRQYPDPVSRWQPHGVHGASRVVDPQSFRWSDGDWKGVALEDFIIYELHTGTFTSEGTFEAVIFKLPYLRQLGITAIELMPVAEFPGTRNWGYDGSCLYAPHSYYGGPTGLKALVDACHRQGIAVLLDVVYNHLGPEGNYLGLFGSFFTEAHRTPWGEALNFDGAGSDGVRRFFTENALYWVTEYHIDALRLDAVHGIFDFGARHILEDLGTAVHRQADALGRNVYLIAESDLNDVRIIKPRWEGGYGLDAQWLDEFHHSLRGLLIDARSGYLADFGKVEHLGKALTEGFIHDGNYSHYRGSHYGSSSKEQPGRQFVVFIQNHDQIANTSQGDRVASLVRLEQQKLAAAVVLCSPYLPLLFMGQEYGEMAPFYYFTSFDDPQLAQAVREGRKKEFAVFSGAHHFADPQDPLTFQQSKLDWSRPDKHPHSAVLRLYRDLIAARKRLPALANCRKDLTQVTFSEEAKWVAIYRGDVSASRAVLVCNFDRKHQEIPIEGSNWVLELWTGAEIYGGGERRKTPPKRPGNSIRLEAAQAALYAAN